MDPTQLLSAGVVLAGAAVTGLAVVVALVAYAAESVRRRARGEPRPPRPG